MTSNTLADKMERNSVLLAPVINHQGQRLYKLPFVTLEQKETIIAALRGQDQAVEASPQFQAGRLSVDIGLKLHELGIETTDEQQLEVAKAALASMGEGE